MSNGKKYRQFAPTKDITGNLYDTNRFIQLPFSIESHDAKTARVGNKRVVTPFTAIDIQSLTKTGNTYRIYFYNGACGAAAHNAKQIDSITSNNNVILVSSASDFPRIEKALKNTRFASYPHYYIDNKRYGNIQLRKQIELIKEACPACYTMHKDDLMFIDYLMIENGEIIPIFTKYSTD